MKNSVLMVLAYYYPYISGVSEYARRMGEGLIKRGHKVTVVTSRHDKRTPPTEIVNGVQVIRCTYVMKASKGLFMPGFVPTVMKEAKHHTTVNVHLPLLEAGLLLKLLPLATITYHCDLWLGRGMINSIAGTIYRKSARMAVRITPKVITYTADYARNSPYLRPYLRKCIYVTPFIDEKHFKGKGGVRTRETHTIGFAGRFVREKGLPYLLDAIPKIIEMKPNTHFLLAGEHTQVAGGSITKHLDRRLRRYRDHITLLGNLPYDTLPDFYRSLDALVLPSIDPLEAFGLVQIESMLCGTPVIASDLPGVREPIRKTGMGLVIRPRSSDAISQAVLKVLGDRRKYIKPRASVVKHYGSGAAILAYERALQ